MGLFKSAKRAVKKITKPVAKVLNKVVPNEIKPFLPYAAAVAPYLLPAGIAGGSGITALLRRGALTGGINLASQLSQEGAEEGDFSALSLGLAGLQGALTAPGAAETFQGMTTAGSPEYLQLGEQATLADAAGNIDLASSALGDQATMLADRGLLTKAADFGLGSLSKGAEAIDTIMTAGKQNPFSMEGLKAASIPFTQGSADLGIATARKALQDYEAELDAFNALAGEQREASDEARRSAIIASMTRADFTQDIIDETLGQLGLKDGGIARLGFDMGGDVSFGGITEAVKNVAKEPKKFLVDELEVTVQPGQSEKMAIVNAIFNDVDNVMPEDRKAEFYKLYLPQLKDSGEISQNDYNSLIKELNLIELDKDYKVTKDPKLIKFIDKLQPAAEGIDNLLKKVGIDVDKMRTGPNIRKAKGGLASFKDGGIMNLGGKEMDMRTGGFIPIGAKERADDVPARLSKNEFVMTADAVRAAGGGSVNKGAKRMYNLMHNLEARA